MSLLESIVRTRWIDQTLAHAGRSPIIAFDPHALREQVVLTEHPTANRAAHPLPYDQDQPLGATERRSLAYPPEHPTPDNSIQPVGSLPRKAACWRAPTGNRRPTGGHRWLYLLTAGNPCR